MTPEKLKRVVKTITTCVTLFLICLVCIITYQCIKIGTLNARIKELDNLSASLSQQEEQLVHGIEIKETGTYLEQQAREQYGMANKGDTIYLPD